MTIGELFVNLGVKGADSAGKAIKGVKDGMGEVASMSLEAKAAIVGVMYGLEELMSHSAKTGTSLMNFSSLTGLSAKSLQQWQGAAREAGVSAEEVTGSVKGVQNAMTNMLLGKGAPEGMAMVANKVGLDPKKFRDTFYMMEKLQKFAQTVPPDVANTMLKSFGLNEGTIAAMRRNAFNPESLKKAPTFSDNEISKLNKADAAWEGVGHKIEMAIGHLSAKHGLTMVEDISKLVTQVMKLVDAFATLAEKLKVFQVIGKVFEGWGMIFSGLNSTVDKINKDKGGLMSGVMNQGKELASGIGLAGKGLMSDIGEKISPNVAQASTSKTQTISVNQNLNFQHDGKDGKKTSDSVKQAVHASYRQMSAQGGGY